MAPTMPDRLDSWKAIADYLDRGLATVRRWEKTLGLPVRRVSGNGRSVFAYPSEIDAWLNGPGGEEARAPKTAAASAPLARSIAAFRGWSVAVLVLLVVVAGVSSVAFHRPMLTAADIKIQVTPDGVTAFDTAGRQRWQHLFPVSDQTAPLQNGRSWRVVAGRDPAVYVATAQRVRQADRLLESGEILSLSINGVPGRSFSFDDRLAFGGVPYGPPWAITSFAVSDEGGRQVAVAAHHYQWEPSIVTVLDASWHRRGTFAHAGWIEGVDWVAPNRLLIAGFSNAHDGGMVALLDPSKLDGRGPEPPGTHYYCDTCGAALPVRMIVMPRTEVNRASNSPFNRAVVEMSPDRVVARTIEVSADQNAADALYEFSPSLDLVRASFSARYWEVHRTLEAEGKLNHTREQCPDHDGPREVQVWDPRSGWRTQKIR